MDGDHSASIAPGHPSEPVPVPTDWSEAASEPGGPYVRPRKFVIQSTFGVPRERRSRKSRPCDACRRRKTACIITTEPPCVFCKQRGILCQSTAAGEAALLARSYLSHDHAMPGRRRARRRQNRARGITSPSASGVNDYSSSQYGHNPTAMDFSTYGFMLDMRIKAEQDMEIKTMNIVQPPLNSPDSSVIGIAHTLEDNPGRTTYFLGRAGEQDPFVLESFSYGILSENSTVDANVIQIHRGGSGIDDPPLHFLFLSMGHPKHINLSIEEASDAIETQVWPHADVLVRLYFRHVHPILPLLSKVRFLRRYASNRKSIPACLRGAVYALASVFWGDDPSTRTGDPFPFPQHEIVDQAHRALRKEIENPNLFVVQACLLLIHVQPPSIDAIEAPSTFTLASQATACAQLIGLHQDPTGWNIEPLEKRLRKKLWWATFVTDCWAAISLGNPPHISDTSYNTVLADMEDLRCDEDVPNDLLYLVDLQNAYFDVASGARFLEYVKLTRLLRIVLDCSFQVNLNMSDLYDRMRARERLADIYEILKDWPSLVQSCLIVPRNRDPIASCYNCPLHLTFYAVKVLLYRALMHPATKAAKSQPNSNVRQWFVCALEEFTQFTEFFVSVHPGDLRGFWGRHARSQLILCGNFLVYLFLMAGNRKHIESAHKLLEDFRIKANKIFMTDHTPTRALIRASTMRTNSFFAQASAVMRHGPEASVAEPFDFCGIDGLFFS